MSGGGANSSSTTHGSPDNPNGPGGTSTLAGSKAPEFVGNVTARYYVDPSTVLTAEQIKAAMEGRGEIREVRVNEKEKTVAFRWTGLYKSLPGLEGACSSEYFSIRILNPLRLDLQISPRGGGTFKTTEMEEALRKAGCSRVTGFGAGAYEVFTTRLAGNLKFLETLREAAGTLNADVKLKSHDVLAYEGEFAPKMAELREAVRSTKGALVAEFEPGKVRILARKSDLKEKELKAACEALGIALKKIAG